ncbi:MAG: OmpA family protein [Bacteroidales bacterium]|jgi:peptidoglycan-associated lipoprotein|nr:OmpA family protein [Bacteroidales bacterium]
MKFFKYSLVALSFWFTTGMFAQKAVEKADDAFNLSQYNYAITLYQKAFTKVKKNEAARNRITYQIAECYRLSGMYTTGTALFRTTVSQYKKAIKARYYDIEPKVYLHFGEIYRFNGDYEDAIEQFEAYLELQPDDSDAQELLKSCQEADKWLKNPSRYIVEPIKKINSKANDWAPRFLDSDEQTIVFTSAREGTTGKKIDDWTGQRFTDFFITSQDKKGAWSTPVLFDEDEILNTTANESDAFFINDGNTVFFTYCANVRKKQSGCLIFTSTYNGEQWSDPEYVPLSSDTVADCVHPWVSANGLTIYFTSNMEGGYGDLDIWMATRSDANSPFGEPKNLGESINTPGKEGWSFLRDTLLYFSSTGHTGLGGFDIFKSMKEGDEWSVPENMQVPVNSSADDFGVTFVKGEERGFLNTNRKDGRGGDDIWSFVLPSINFTISGIVRDDQTMQLISQALVQIVGSDGLSVQAFTNNRGFYRFDETQIKQNVTYKLWVSKSGYLEANATETTVDLNNGKDLVRDFRLSPLPKGAVVLPDILYDVAKWDLKEQYQDSLMGLIELLERNPRLVIELASHTDSRPIAMTNDSLSQYRAQEVVNYLISRGIHPGRLVAKGYGSRSPRVFLNDQTITNGKQSLALMAGDILSDDFIKSLPKDQQEMAHQLNRRTEFSILRDDFIPPAEGSTGSLDNLVQMADIDEDKRIAFRINPNGMPEVPVVVNGTSFTFVYDSSAKQNLIGIEDAMRLLRTGKINKNDFKNNENAFDEEGDILPNSVINLRELKIGKLTLSDISVTVTPELPAPILLNTEALKGLGEFRINRAERILELK